MKIKLKDLNYNGVWVNKRDLKEKDFNLIEKYFNTDVRHWDKYLNFYKNSGGKLEPYDKDILYDDDNIIMITLQEFRYMFSCKIQNKLK